MPRKILACIGFGVDAYHGVCHAQFLEAVAALTRDGGFLGAFSLLPTMTAVQRYVSAVEFVHGQPATQPSIVNASILSAIEGQYGDHHRTVRTKGSALWINPIMAQYFAFRLDAVADRALYLPQLRHTHTLFEVVAIIEAFRHQCTIRPRERIPV